MAEGGGNIVGNANVVLGADTTKLEAGLSTAKAETIKSVQETQAAINAAPAGGDDSERYQQRLQEMAAAQAMERREILRTAEAAERADRIERDRAKAAQRATVAAAEAATATSAFGDKAEQSAARATKGISGFSDSIRGVVAPVHRAVGAIGQLVGTFAQFVGIGTVVTGAGYAIIRMITAKRDAAIAANKAISDLSQKLISLQRQDVTGTFDPDAEANAIRKAYDDRIEAENDIYTEKVKIADKAGKRITGETIERERRARIDELQKEREQRIADLYKYQDAMRKKRQSDDAAAELERQKLAREADQELNRLRQEDLDRLLNDYAKIGQQLAEQNTQFMKAQQDQFAALRGEINSLFNTGQLEIGINRLGALLEVLVQKTEDRR